jgi:hypothetical protein
MGKHFIDPKSSEILSIFQVFPCTMQIALFWPKLLPVLFLKKPRYPCPFEILEETLKAMYPVSVVISRISTLNVNKRVTFSDKLSHLDTRGRDSKLDDKSPIIGYLKKFGRITQNQRVWRTRVN